MIKGTKTIAEYAIRRWLENQRFEMNMFSLEMKGNKGILRDSNGDSMTLVYDKESKEIWIKE